MAANLIALGLASSEHEIWSLFDLIKKKKLKKEKDSLGVKEDELEFKDFLEVF